MHTIGTSDLHVYPLTLGANTFGWTSDERTSFDVLNRYVASGGNFIDTADVYSAWAQGNEGGESEKIIGNWFESLKTRRAVILATKVAQWEKHLGLSPANIISAAEESLKRLRTDYIDLYYAHAEDPNTPIEESVAAFAQLQKDGKIRHVGLSNFTADSIRAWIDAADKLGVPRPVALQPHYNLVFRKEYEDTLRDTAAEFSLGVMPYFALAAGFLTGKYDTPESIEGSRAEMVRRYASPKAFKTLTVLKEIAAAHSTTPTAISLAWLRMQPTVVAPIASARTVEQLPALIASTELNLSEDEVNSLNSVSA